MIKQLPNGTLWALLLLPLVISPLLGLLTPYVALLVIIPLFVVTLVRRDALAAYSSYDARALLGIFVLFAIICAVTADSVSDTLRAFNFTMFLAYGAIALFLERRSKPWRSGACGAAGGGRCGDWDCRDRCRRDVRASRAADRDQHWTHRSVECSAGLGLYRGRRCAGAARPAVMALPGRACTGHRGDGDHRFARSTPRGALRRNRGRDLHLA